MCDNYEHDYDEDEEERDSFNEDDYDLFRETEKYSCTCGAYQMTKNGFVQVADCCCGRT